MWKFLKQHFMPEYSSEIDQFLQGFDRSHPDLSKSQRKEQEKYRRIYKMRDNDHGVA